jgi:putative peptidoglycan lipid II flippase
MSSSLAVPTGRDASGLVGSVTALALLALVAKGFGFAEKLVLAYYAGTGPVVDAYFTAVNLTFLLFVIADDIMAPVFLVRLVTLREKLGPRAAGVLTRRVLTAAMLVLGGVTTAGALFPEGFVRLLAPGFDFERTDQTVELLRWMFPAGWVLGVSALTYAALNAQDRFAWPALSTTLYKVVLVAGIAAIYPVLGATGIGIAVLVGAVAQLVTQLLGLRRGSSPEEVPGEGRLPAGEWGTMLAMMAPLAVGTLASQAGGFVDNAMGSILKSGSIAALGFARRLVELPILLVPTALGIVAFPRLVRLASTGGGQSVMEMLGRLIVFSLVLFLPLTIMFVLASDSVVAIVFARGRFDASSVAITGLALQCFALGLCAYAIEILIQRTFYATLDMRTPIVVGLLCLAMNVALTVWLTPTFGIVVIPLAVALQKTLKTVVLFAILARRHPGAWSATLRGRLLRLPPCALLFAMVFALHRPLHEIVPWPGKIGMGAALAVAGILGLTVYVLMLSWMRLVSVAEMLAWLRTRVMGGSRG